MRNSYEWVKAVKSAKSISSDYKAAQFFGVSPQYMSKIKYGRKPLSKAMCFQAAEALKIGAGEILATVAAESAKDPVERRAWEDLLKKVGTVAACFILFFSFSVAPAPANAAQITADSLYYVK